MATKQAKSTSKAKVYIPSYSSCRKLHQPIMLGAAPVAMPMNKYIHMYNIFFIADN